MTFPGTCSNILLVLVSATTYKVQCASGSAVEHLLAKEGVAGSIPVSRFFYYKKGISDGDALFCNREAEASQTHLLHKWVRISPAGSVGAKQVPPAPSTPSRAGNASKFDCLRFAPVVASTTSTGRCATSRAPLFILHLRLVAIINSQPESNA